jgi:hemolysin III
LVESTLENTGTDAVALKPLLRGWSHFVGLFGSLVSGPLVVMHAKAGTPRTLALLYALSLTTLLGVSSLYHLVKWTPARRMWMRRLDHAAIFVLVGGTSSVFALALPPEDQTTYLTLLWGGCSLGTARTLFWPKGPKWVVALTFLAVSWGTAAFVPTMAPRMPPGVVWLLLLGGVTYSLGALCYALKAPNPVKGVFGYHECFHALVLIAAVMHYVAVHRMVE